MARSIETDEYQNFRFHVASVDSAFLGQAKEAGFNAVSVPEMSLEATEYREGTGVFTKKLAGLPTFSEITMSQGVTKTRSQFWQWAQRAAKGGEYRTDLVIMHFSREETEGTDSSGKDLWGATTSLRYYKALNCVPVRCKLSSDLDATSGEVSIMDLDVAVEEIELYIDGEKVS
jgi:phage tail-like protein